MGKTGCKKCPSIPSGRCTSSWYCFAYRFLYPAPLSVLWSGSLEEKGLGGSGDQAVQGVSPEITALTFQV